MEIDFDKIIEIYGEDVVELIRDNIEEVVLNINYLIDLKFTDVENIFERVAPIFIYDNKTFMEKINGLIKRLGVDYVNIIESDLGILEELE